MNNNVNLNDYKQTDGKYDLMAVYRAIYGYYDPYFDAAEPEGFESFSVLIAALEKKTTDVYDAILDTMVMRVPDVPVHPLLVEAWKHNQTTEPTSEQIIDQLPVSDRKIYDQELAQHVTTEGNYLYVACAELEIAFDWQTLRLLEATKGISTKAYNLALEIQQRAVVKFAASVAPQIMTKGEADWNIREVWLLAQVDYLNGFQPYSIPQGTIDLLDLNDVLTASEVCEKFGLSESAVRKTIERGKVKARKSGDTWLLRRVDAEARWKK